MWLWNNSVPRYCSESHSPYAQGLDHTPRLSPAYGPSQNLTFNATQIVFVVHGIIRWVFVDLLQILAYIGCITVLGEAIHAGLKRQGRLFSGGNISGKHCSINGVRVSRLQRYFWHSETKCTGVGCQYVQIRAHCFRSYRLCDLPFVIVAVQSALSTSSIHKEGIPY